MRTWQRRARAPNVEVCTLFSLILVRFNLSLIFLHLSQLVIYYFPSILVSCMHQRDITLVARCGFVRRNTCSSSTFVYTSHKVFFPHRHCSSLVSYRSFFSSFIKQQVYKRYAAYHGRYYVAREVILARYVKLIFFVL